MNNMFNVLKAELLAEITLCVAHKAHGLELNEHITNKWCNLLEFNEIDYNRDTNQYSLTTLSYDDHKSVKAPVIYKSIEAVAHSLMVIYC